MTRHAEEIVEHVAVGSLKTGQSGLWQLAAPLWSVEEPTADDADRAAAVIAFVQAAYREREAFAVREARELAANHALAVRILRQRWGGSNKNAKEAQLRASDGKPLAVCVGNLTIDVARGLNEWTLVQGRYGCGRVFPDSTRTSARLWATTCPQCRDLRTPRRRAAKRSAKRHRLD